MDIDIDFGNRDKALAVLKHIPATIIRDDKPTKHNSGIYVQNIPQNPITGLCTLDYKEAEERGYMKLDFLNMHIYNLVESETELVELMTQEPDWAKLLDPEICSKLVHISEHQDVVAKVKPQSVEDLAIVLALIRPSKRYLLNKSWAEIKEHIWTKPQDEGYAFKHSHAISYALLVIIHLNLLCKSELLY
jgi:DNA polymerase III alpha subunit